jgi:hypothetical protein
LEGYDEGLEDSDCDGASELLYTFFGFLTARVHIPHIVLHGPLHYPAVLHPQLSLSLLARSPLVSVVKFKAA